MCGGSHAKASAHSSLPDIQERSPDSVEKMQEEKKFLAVAMLMKDLIREMSRQEGII